MNWEVGSCEEGGQFPLRILQGKVLGRAEVAAKAKNTVDL